MTETMAENLAENVKISGALFFRHRIFLKLQGMVDIDEAHIWVKFYHICMRRNLDVAKRNFSQGPFWGDPRLKAHFPPSHGFEPRRWHFWAKNPKFSIFPNRTQNASNR